MKFIIKLNNGGGYNPQPIPFTYSSKEDLHNDLRTKAKALGVLLRKRSQLQSSGESLVTEFEKLSKKKQAKHIDEINTQYEKLQSECDALSAEMRPFSELDSECKKYRINIYRILNVFYTYAEPMIYTVDEYFESEEIKE